MSNSDRNSVMFHKRLRIVARDLLGALSTLETDNDLGSLALNWRALGLLENGAEKQEEALGEALEYLDPQAFYASDDEGLREEIQRLLSDIMDTMLPSPVATPSPNSSTRSGSGDTVGSEGTTEQDQERLASDNGESMTTGVTEQEKAQGAPQ